MKKSTEVSFREFTKKFTEKKLARKNEMVEELKREYAVMEKSLAFLNDLIPGSIYLFEYEMLTPNFVVYLFNGFNAKSLSGKALAAKDEVLTLRESEVIRLYPNLLRIVKVTKVLPENLSRYSRWTTTPAFKEILKK